MEEIHKGKRGSFLSTLDILTIQNLIMDYLFENLGDERFQEFCHCLISKEFPDAQAFPVGQPDGGRDSVVYTMNKQKKDFIVFQVKFVRNPKQMDDPHKWLIQTLEKEVKKINTLIPKGAIKYYLLTNVNGTAHLNSGAIDKLNKELEKSISIPAVGWWREDLARLFEKDPLFKWSFPEILNGQEILNSVLFQNLNENKEKRESVIRAYLTDQYEMDNEVKFRQIDLQNRLLDLFTDVPIRMKKVNLKNKILRQTLGSISNYQSKIISAEYVRTEEVSNMGAAEFLLHPKVQNEIERILLEGGPGQGKSTISQYICQAHRARLLNKLGDLDLLSENIKNTPVRLPIKIDLRHVAAWVEKKNPYQGILSEDYFDKIWKNSLEAFLLGHIFYHSQLEDFTSSDLVAVFKVSSVLFVFDGFDEIANINVREEVIEFINKGINRISSNSKSIQVLITSRPAAFSDSVGFSVDLYPHFELTDITAKSTKEYVEKWVKASKLNSREAAEIKRLVEEKLKMPHLKDLAKSPMQLAIFISLLRTRGESLPNKRTALYDSYIELFFNRESEKNSSIRDKRDLIIDIHQYLAWILHSEAELYKNSGSIHIDDLKEKLKEYLFKEGHDPEIADKLFDVMNERVCALVSRVQGTFEFEVQPLREYFCAKYLYNTAPHSPLGLERSGTKPDIFDAISKNFYWQNVVRFFSGCFGKGELPMLIQKLKELQDHKILRYTNYPRVLTSQILSDYVFTQYPLLLKDIVSIIVDGINVGNIINQQESQPNTDPILLPEECGRTELISECFDQLKKFPSNDYAKELIGIINNNPFNVIEKWLEFSEKLTGEKLTEWLQYGYELRIVYKMDAEVLVNLVKSNDDKLTQERLQILVKGNRIDIVERDLHLKNTLLNAILKMEIFLPNRSQSTNSIEFLSIVLHPYLLSNLIGMETISLTFIQFISNAFRHYQEERHQSRKIYEFKVNDHLDEQIESFSKSIKPIYDYNVNEFRSSIEPWESIVENGRRIFGENWAFNILANIAAGIKTNQSNSEEYSDLNEKNISLCRRVKYARHKSGNSKYWQNQISNSKDHSVTFLTFFTWATPKVIVQLLSLIDKELDLLCHAEFIQISNGIEKSVRVSTFSKAQVEYVQGEVEKNNFCDRTKYILSLRFNDLEAKKFVYHNVTSTNEANEKTAIIKLEYLLELFFANTTDGSLLLEIKKVYQKINNYNKLYYNRRYSNDSIKIPFEIAKGIMKECRSFPSIITSLAEKACRIEAHKHTEAVGKIAEREKWFQAN